MPAKNKKEILIKFGENLSDLRKKRNLSLRKLSTLCDVDYSDIKKYEDGDVNPTLSTIVELASGLGIHPKELMEFGVDFASVKEKKP